jgi:hypothetical protein
VSKISAKDARFVAEEAADIRVREFGEFASNAAKETWIVGFIAGFLAAEARVRTAPMKEPQ